MNDGNEFDALAHAAAGGDRAALAKLIEQLWPFWLNRVRTRNAMRLLSHSGDHVLNVVGRLAQKLLNPGTLESYARWQSVTPRANFMQWLHRVTDNEVLDYVRSVAGRAPQDAAADDGPSAKLLLNEFSTSPLLEELGIRPPNTELQTAQELLIFARKRLRADQLEALTLWLQGDSDEEIAKALGIDEDSSRLLRRAAIARLRREFAPEAKGS